jgi:hypothetical protein
MNTDKDGFIPVSQYPNISQATVVANKRLCTVLALSSLTDPASIARVKLNCKAATMANASRAAVPDSFSWHNTAYDVKSDGKGGYVLNTDVSAIMADNTVIPDTETTEDQVVQYANMLPIFTEIQKQQQMTPTQDGAAMQALKARQAAKAAKKNKSKK